MKARDLLWLGWFAGSLLLGAQPVDAQRRLVLEPESRLWIEGTSSVNAFTCRAGEVDGYGFIKEAASLNAGFDAAQAGGEMLVPVRSFDCGKKRMNQDFFKALKGDAFPEIRFELERADVLRHDGPAEAPYELRATGLLTIAGTGRRLDLTVTGRRLSDGLYQVQGSQALLMSDFGIDPPTALLGLIKAHERIVVRFDLVAALRKRAVGQRRMDGRSGLSGHGQTESGLQEFLLHASGTALRARRGGRGVTYSPGPGRFVTRA